MRRCRVVAALAALLAVATGDCDTDTLFFGDLDPAAVSPYRVQVISALGTYVREANNISLTAYRHIGQPDVFLLREPTDAPRRLWVIATLPDDKKPTLVRHAYEAWPAADNVIAQARLTVDPWRAGAGAWLVRDCDDGRSPMAGLAVACVPPQFGQCASDTWLVAGGGRAAQLSGQMRRGAAYAAGRPVYTSLTARLSVGADGLWRVRPLTPGGVGLVSGGVAERLEFVRTWRVVDERGDVADDAGVGVSCEPVPAAAGADPCAGAPCLNGGTCVPAADGAAAYFCRCPFDSVSLNCAQVRECAAPPAIVNGHLLFTSHLALHGKAFYRCDVGFYIRGADATGSAAAAAGKQANTFAICDGSQWKNVPKCQVVTTDVTIEQAYIHHCDFDAGWCDYRHLPGLTLRGPSLGWQRQPAAAGGGDSSEGRGQVAVARQTAAGDGRPAVARLRTPCMFVPSDGCVAVDVRLSPTSAGNVSLAVVDDDEVTLWRTAARSDWTTATLTLPPGGNRLTFEAVVQADGDTVAVDNVRVFQWNCQQVSRLLFPPASGAVLAVQSALLSLLPLLALLIYSRATGIVAAA